MKIIALVLASAFFATGCGAATSEETADGTESTGDVSQAIVGDCAKFVSEDPPYDNAIVAKNKDIRKVWRIKNCGTTTWTSSYRFWNDSYYPAGFYGGVSTGKLTSNVAPGATIPVFAWVKTTNLSNTKHEADFHMRNGNGVNFGDMIWVIVKTP